MSLRLGERQKSFKKGIDSDESRRRREDTAIQIRKTIKEDRLNQRRRMVSTNAIQEENIETSFKSSISDNTVSLDDLPKFAAMIHSLDVKKQTIAVEKLRRLLSLERDPPIQEIINIGVVPLLVNFLKLHNEPRLQFESAWALTNIASGTSEHTSVVINSGAVPILCELLVSPNYDVCEQAVWALGNISGDSPQCRDMVLNLGAIMPLLAVLQRSSSKLSMLRNATWTLSNFCRGKPKPDFNLVSPALHILPHLIYSNDHEVLADACWTLSYLSDGLNDRIQAVIDSGVCRQVVELIGHPWTSIQIPALRTVGNVVTGDEAQTQSMLDLGVIARLLPLLKHQKKVIRKEACWTISNITAGSRSQIQEVIGGNIIPPLINQLSTAEFEVKKEAAWAISNALKGGSPEQIKFLVHQGCIPPLVNLLGCPDTKIINMCLDAIENILRIGEKEAHAHGENKMALYIEEADGIDKIQVLQYHHEQDLYDKAVQILEKYFDSEEDVDTEVAPEQDLDSKQFSFGTGQIANENHVFNFNH